MIMPPDRSDDLTLQNCLFALRKKFTDDNIDTADLDARLLVQAATGVDHAGLILKSDHILTAQERRTIKKMSQRRLRREPVSRILGEREFYGRDFIVTSDVLDPRPDTETLIEVVLTAVQTLQMANRPLDILDIGTGTGAIIVTLLCELPHAKGVATDVSPAALEVARRNGIKRGVAERLNLEETSWCAGIQQQFDIIVSNPPYIVKAEIEKLDRDVKDFDPHLALNGGPDGLDAYRKIAEQCPARMKPGGLIVLEAGFDQAVALASLLMTAGFKPHDDIPIITKDLGGNDRVVTMLWP